MAARQDLSTRTKNAIALLVTAGLVTGACGSDDADGELLYVVKGIIDTWSPEKAESYAKRGYVHYHELISVADGTLHPTKVVWLKHTAVASFTLDGGTHPEVSHEVTPGVHTNFIPNGMMPYNP